jgi:hypothetical protein
LTPIGKKSAHDSFNSGNNGVSRPINVNKQAVIKMTDFRPRGASRAPDNESSTTFPEAELILKPDNTAGKFVWNFGKFRLYNTVEPLIRQSGRR